MFDETITNSITQTFTTVCSRCGETLWSHRERVNVSGGRSFSRIVWEHSNPGHQHKAIEGRTYANH